MRDPFQNISCSPGSSGQTEQEVLASCLARANEALLDLMERVLNFTDARLVRVLGVRRLPERAVIRPEGRCLPPG